MLNAKERGGESCLSSTAIPASWLSQAPPSVRWSSTCAPTPSAMSYSETTSFHWKCSPWTSPAEKPPSPASGLWLRLRHVALGSSAGLTVLHAASERRLPWPRAPWWERRPVHWQLGIQFPARHIPRLRLSPQLGCIWEATGRRRSFLLLLPSSLCKVNKRTLSKG